MTVLSDPITVCLIPAVTVKVCGVGFKSEKRSLSEVVTGEVLLLFCLQETAKIAQRLITTPITIKVYFIRFCIIAIKDSEKYIKVGIIPKINFPIPSETSVPQFRLSLSGIFRVLNQLY